MLIRSKHAGSVCGDVSAAPVSVPGDVHVDVDGGSDSLYRSGQSLCQAH